MSIAKVVTGDSCELKVAGRVDGAMANELEVEVIAAVKAGAARIGVNLGQATFLCSAAIRVILQYHRQLKQQGKRLVINATSAEIDSILELTGFREHLVEKC